LFERISASGASALRCELVPDGAPDGRDALRLYYFDPASAVLPRPRPLGAANVGLAVDTVLVSSGEARARTPTGLTVVRPPNSIRAVEQRVGLAHEAPGDPPADFEVASPETLGRLDQHSAIVVLMMEDRSYDPFFHDLAEPSSVAATARFPSGLLTTRRQASARPLGSLKMRTSPSAAP
jgi:hypothetical protein